MDLDPKILVAVVVVIVTLLVFLSKGGSAKKFLEEHNRERVSVPLIKKTQISHDTIQLRFGLPSNNQVLGLPIGKHVMVYCPNVKGCKEGQWNGRDDEETDAEIERKYTPTSLDSQKGSFDLVIKVYKPNVLPQFPDGGKMSMYFDSLKVGDKIDITGPWGVIEYSGPSTFKNMNKVMNKSKIGMIAGGTGITPMLQIIGAILADPSDQTQLSLIYANKSEEDILVRDMLEKYAEDSRFKLHYTLDNPPANWKYSKGFISESMIADNLPAPSDDTVVLMCGPPPMIKFACKPNLDKLGYGVQLTF